MARLRALVVYAADHWPLRTAIEDHLLALTRSTAFDTVLFNALRRTAPSWISEASFDVVVFHTTFLAQRWQDTVFASARRNVQTLKAVDCPRVAMPQDEFLKTEVLCDFLREFEVGHVLSCAPQTEWPKIYGSLQPQPTIRSVLTGYLAPSTVARFARFASRRATAQPVDIGYRAWRAQPWLGRHGMLKTTIAAAVKSAAPAHDLLIDVSLEERDTLIGDAWLRFLVGSRYTLGVEGGASILDADGSVKACTEALLAGRPDATFDDVEAACFPGRDGELDLFAISPRHLEACAAGTGQILVRGEFNGILRPDVHYLPLEPDFSNLDAVLDAVHDEGLRQRLTANAYRDVVASKAYSYDRFVDELLASIGPAARHPSRPRPIARLVATLAVAWDQLDRLILRCRPGARWALGMVGLLGPLRAARARMRRAPRAQG